MFKLEYVHPDRLRDWWNAIRPGVEEIRKDASDDWIPEDVYAAIRAGTSQLHVVTMGGDYAGFVVITPTFTEFSKERVLHVWLAYSSGDYDIWEPTLDELKRSARAAGIKVITCTSTRRGFAKRGFEQKYISYEMRL